MRTCRAMAQTGIPDFAPIQGDLGINGADTTLDLVHQAAKSAPADPSLNLEHRMRQRIDCPSKVRCGEQHAARTGFA
jgi:hypothetical protein